MQADFQRCNYPSSLIENVFEKIKKMERSVEKKPKREVVDDRINVITTHGRDSKLVKVLDRIEKSSENISFRYTKKTAPSLHNTLVRSKVASLGQPKGKTMPCKTKSNNCMTCKMVSKQDHVLGPNEKIIKTAEAQCNTRCLIYHASCRYCEKCYVGKTIQPLNKRLCGHRSKFYDTLKYSGDRLDLDDDDDYALGLHLYLQHGIRDQRGFNGSFAVTALERCNSQNLDLKEHLWIQRLKTIKPRGLNSHDPFGFVTVF